MPFERVKPGVIKVVPRKLTFAERIYLPKVIAGMFVTLRHLIRNLLQYKKLPIISYPEVKRVYSERFRGRHILTTREDGTTRCVACYMCSTACPAECITIEAGEDERTREKFPVRYEMASDTRARAVVGLRDLVVPPNFPVEPMGWRPYYGALDKKGTAGGTGLGQPLREAPYDDDAPPNPDLYRGA